MKAHIREDFQLSSFPVGMRASLVNGPEFSVQFRIP